jgi:hypothetical protein
MSVPGVGKQSTIAAAVYNLAAVFAGLGSQAKLLFEIVGVHTHTARSIYAVCLIPGNIYKTQQQSLLYMPVQRVGYLHRVAHP